MAVMTLAVDKVYRVPSPYAIAIAWLVLLIGIPVSIYLFTFTRDSVERVAQLRFEREAQHVHEEVQDRLLEYSEVLYSLRALFATNTSVDRLRFHRFVEALDLNRRIPGVLSLNYAAYVLAQDKDAFVKAVRADTTLDSEGYPGFSIKSPGERPEYYVLKYLEPMAGYEFAFGLDLGGTPLTKDNKKVAQAILLGRDSGRLTSSAQPLRIAGASESIYLAMRLAVYSTGLPVDTVEQRRIAYIGSVGAAFDVDSMMKSAIKSNLLPFVHLKLYDKGSSTGQRHSDSTEIRQLLYDTHPQAAVTAKLAAMDSANSMIVHKIPLELAGRIWEVEFRAPRNETTRGIDQWLPSLVMSAGLLLTALLFAVVYTLTTSRGRAIALAGEITKDLRESESGLAEAQQVAHLGSWTLNPATWRMSWSAETYRILEMEVRTSPEDYAEALKVVHKDDRAPLDKAFRHAVENGLSAHVDHRVCLPNGKIRWLHTIIRPVVHGQRGLMRGTIMDITERKRADNAVKESRQQLLALSRRLVDIQEVERRRFSTELHDVVGQNLTALSFNLDILKTQLSGNENNAVNLRLDDSAKLVRSTSDAVDNVLSELRPPMLDDYGLFAALQWYAEQFSIRTGVQAVVHGDESIQRLKPVAEIALFRVAQEALNNIAKHACANGVEIRLERTASQCVMSVSDDGKGFDVAARAIFHRKNGSDAVATTERRRERLGMVTMRERVLAVGGTFEVKSAPGQGTRVELRVPY